jgi:hypothetical protein
MALVALLATEMGLNFDNLTPSFFRFGYQELEKHGPSGIGDVLTEMAVTNHVLDLQIFNANQLIGFDVVIGCLVHEIFSLSGCLGMGLGYMYLGFLATIGTFLTAVNFPLLFFQLFLGFDIVSGILNRLAVGIAISTEVEQIHINTCFFMDGFRILPGRNIVTGKAHIPISPGRSLDSYRFNLSLDLTGQS